MRFQLTILLLVFLFVAGCATGSSVKKEYRNITEVELKKMMQEKDFFLLDVHVPEVRKHLNGTDAFIPYNEIENNSEKLPQDKNMKIVVYCRSGRMSAIAAQKLVEMGYTNVYNIADGVEEYRANDRNGAVNSTTNTTNATAIDFERIKEKVIPSKGINLGVKWGDIGKKTVESGAINIEKLESAMIRNGRPITPEQKEILKNRSDEFIVIDQNNSNFILYVFWAFGLVNKNPVLENGPMGKDPSMIPRLASTAGWPLGERKGTELYNSNTILKLDEKQQAVVEEVVANTYRPCCNNPASFPDCNHGMGALGLAEWMAYNNKSKEEIYNALLAANSYWFPQAYVETAAYFELQNRSWESVEPKEILSANYSSASGYYRTKQKLSNIQGIVISRGSCGV